MVAYFDEYKEKFQLKSLFSHTVVNAAHEEKIGMWRVSAIDTNRPEFLLEYVTKLLVIASRENCEHVLHQGLGRENFKGPIIHSS